MCGLSLESIEVISATKNWHPYLMIKDSRTRTNVHMLIYQIHRLHLKITTLLQVTTNPHRVWFGHFSLARFWTTKSAVNSLYYILIHHQYKKYWLGQVYRALRAGYSHKMTFQASSFSRNQLKNWISHSTRLRPRRAHKTLKCKAIHFPKPARGFNSMGCSICLAVYLKLVF